MATSVAPRMFKNFINGLYGFHGCRPNYFTDMCAGIQALQPGDGWKEHHHRDG